MINERWQALCIKKGKTHVSKKGKTHVSVNLIGAGENIFCGCCYHEEREVLITTRRVAKRTVIFPLQSSCEFCGAWLYWRKIYRTDKKKELGRKIVVDG